MLFNGLDYNKDYANWTSLVEGSSAKTATGNGSLQQNYNHRGAVLYVATSAVTGTTPTLTVKVQGSYDGTTWVDVSGAVTGTINATGTTVLAVYPGVTVAANAAVSYPLPRLWRVAWTIGGTTPSFTFAVCAAYVL